MAILANLQALKDKIILSIKGASTNSSEKTKAIDHREVLIDAVDTLASLIPVVPPPEPPVVLVYKETFVYDSESPTFINHKLNSRDLHVSLWRLVADSQEIPVNLIDDNLTTFTDNDLRITELIPAQEYRVIVTAY